MSKKVIIGIICAIAAVAVIGTSIVLAVNSNPKKKIYDATKKTLESSGYLVENLSKFNFKGSKMTYSVDVRSNDLELEALVTTDGNDKGVSAKLINDSKTVFEAQATIDSKDVKAVLPGTDYEKLLVYRYTADEKDGLEDLVGKDRLKEIDSAIQAVYDVKYGASNTKELEKSLKAWVKELKSEKLDKKSFKVDGDKHDCKGYRVVIKDDDIEDLGDILNDWYKEEYADIADDSLFDSAADIDKTFKELAQKVKKIEMSFYIYKGMLAGIVIEIDDEKLTIEFSGSDYRMQEVTAYTGKKSDNNVVFTINGKIKDTKETVTFEIPDKYNFKYQYDKSNGKFEVNGQSYSYWYGGYSDIFTVKGNLEVSGSNLTMKLNDIAVSSLPISLDKFVIEISSKASMPKLKGSEFRIDEADKDDLNDEFKEISSELMSALSESGLLNSIKDLF